MLMPAIDLDAGMSAGAVLQRLALNGYWLDAAQDAARARITAVAARVGRPIEEVAARLARNADDCGAAIRRQWGTHVLWYARELREVLVACSHAPPALPLLDVLDLHEPDSQPPIDIGAGAVVMRNGVTLLNGEPVGVSLRVAADAFVLPARAPAPADMALRGADPLAPATAGAARPTPTPMPTPVAPPAGPIKAWPRIEAPEAKAAGEVFEVVVGFGAQAQAQVSGAAVDLPFSAEVQALDLQVELSAGPGVQAPEGWSRPLRVTAADVATAQVSFKLVGVEPENPAQPFLTMLEVRYVLGGTVCGTASRALAIMPAAHGDRLDPRPLGQPWQAMPAAATPVALVADAKVPDLTLDIGKPDRNAASGQYVCRLISPHALATATGPFDMDLGQDAKTFARSVVEEVRQYGNSALLATALESLGRLVAERLPGEFFQALAELSGRLAPEPVSLLIVSAEPYVPWELAWMDAPLDAARPSYLGAQTLAGRWLRDSAPPPLAANAAARPAAHPIASLQVRNMATMAAWYSAASGLRKLPKAEAEVEALSGSYPGVTLKATAEGMRDLLNATLQGKSGPVAVEAVHLAGHGDFDPTRPDGSAMFLQDGAPLRSTLFRAAKYGGERQPLLFLNACMLGIGGELLGDMAGFPGNSLRGGFGGVLGALWEVDDDVAHDIAIEFWRRALPAATEASDASAVPAAPAEGEPVGAILRDLRARYPGTAGTPIPTFLSYVYYGHPRLTLRRAP
ncbi:CHAT domain-containing protein [Variovorax sp. J22G73]|uniref:TCAD7 domain-containing protein n=1 Tax=unclassified Variovorax TaxID=663243 RepID=UPI0025790871|nr:MULTISPECIES: TCAD7 domain-containing protein [unclassified Variovorax]MDM0005738.1 CHAT domain-containing protein [Variovorax sp. J22R203]MDM0099765.1 CHAT domain-containing protein [Variovorax sp. J22G73]